MRGFLAIIALSYSSLSYAQQTLYESDYGMLSAGLQIQTATLLEGNNRSGDPTKQQLSDVYGELTVEPNVKATINLPKESQLYAGFSFIYSAISGNDPSAITQRGVLMPLEKTDFTEYGYYKNFKDAGLTEEKYIGWKSGKLLEKFDANMLDLSAGAQDYKLGTGLLLANGTDDGGYRGSYWIGSRTAFTNTLIARINTNGIKLEGFHLETRPRNPTTRRNYDGVNVEYNYHDIATVGVSYINANNKGNKRNIHEEGSLFNTAYTSMDNDIYNIRLSFIPLATALPDLSISGEYVNQHNNITTQPIFDAAVVDRHIAQGGYAQIEYKFSKLAWQPNLSYRYTRLGKGFDSMAYGFKTWGTWFQGEINGEFILDNSNLITQVGRLTLTPTERISLNLIYLNYEFVNPSAFDLTSSHYGNEIDLLADWSVNDTVDLAAGFETFVPSEAGQQYLGGNKTWVQGMLYASFKF